jgi:exonuclease SbcC
MRPLLVELEGFSAYRRSARIDFADADFFSLTGPTGSGKSSLIDAMIFALFGRVPRLGGNAVAPAITAGADQAKVRFDFESDGVAYTVVRMAARTPSGGATVKEARLESGERVLASGADEVTRGVEELLKLRFDDFTRTVVLPQGDFARFLTATKAERQGLLRNLLGLDVYTRVRELAKTRGAVAGERAAGDRRSLEAIDLLDEEAEAEATARVEALARLAEDTSNREKELVELDRAVAIARQDEAKVTDAASRLRVIEIPAHLDELDSAMAEARSDVADAEASLAEILEQLRQVEEKHGNLPTVERLTGWRRARERFIGIEGRIAAAGDE